MPNAAPLEKVETIYGTFYSWEGEMITNQLKQYSAHTRNEIAMIKSFIRDGDNIIDIGAHIGTFSIPFARFNEGHGKIFSFEASPENVALLKKNIAANGLDEVVLPVQGVVAQERQHFIKMTPPKARSSVYYYVADPDASETGLASINIDDWHDHHARETPIHFIKIDVEGAEVSALQSCRRLIEKYKPVLYVEVNRKTLPRLGSSPEEIDALLKAWGYHYFRNIGERNSDHDRFTMVRQPVLKAEERVYDIIAVPPSSSRYPNLALL